MSLLLGCIIIGGLMLVFGIKGVNSNRNQGSTPVVLNILGGIIVLVGFGLYPIFNVWQAEMAGKAALAEANSAKKIITTQAEAEKDAAAHYAQAEIVRAGGVKEANDIIANGLGGPEGYLTYLFIQKLDKANTIYLATEAGLPVLEAGRAVNTDMLNTPLSLEE